MASLVVLKFGSRSQGFIAPVSPNIANQTNIANLNEKHLVLATQVELFCREPPDFEYL